MKRAVRSVIRLAAAGIMIIGALYLGMDFMRYRFQGGRPSAVQLVLGMIAIGAGLVLFLASSALAARLADHFDE